MMLTHLIMDFSGCRIAKSRSPAISYVNLLIKNTIYAIIPFPTKAAERNFEGVSDPIQVAEKLWGALDLSEVRPTRINIRRKEQQGKNNVHPELLCVKVILRS